MKIPTPKKGQPKTTSIFDMYSMAQSPPNTYFLTLTYDDLKRCNQLTWKQKYYRDVMYISRWLMEEREVKDDKTKQVKVFPPIATKFWLISEFSKTGRFHWHLMVTTQGNLHDFVHSWQKNRGFYQYSNHGNTVSGFLKVYFYMRKTLRDMYMQIHDLPIQANDKYDAHLISDGDYNFLIVTHYNWWHVVSKVKQIAKKKIVKEVDNRLYSDSNPYKFQFAVEELVKPKEELDYSLEWLQRQHPGYKFKKYDGKYYLDLGDEYYEVI